MKYIDEQYLIDAWLRIITSGESSKASLNKFFGLLEIINQIDEGQAPSIQTNICYSVRTSQLSNALQDLYYFGASKKDFTSSLFYYAVFPFDWQDNVFQILLKNKSLSISDVATICLHNNPFQDNQSSSDIVNLFRTKYKISSAEEMFFTTELTEINFSTEKSNRINLLRKFKELFNSLDSYNFTIGFERSLLKSNPGNLPQGPFIQPLYASLEGSRMLLLSDFDLSQHYNITPFGTPKQPQSTPTISIDDIPRNKIIYGAPGTGKSYELHIQAKKSGFRDENTIRITFHPNYTYQQFVGTYKPTPLYKTIANENIELFGSNRFEKLKAPFDKEPLIDYSFVPGPLLNLLIKSYENINDRFLLIIEEINRAVVSSVFGDVFQLLDRDENTGESQYDIQFNQDILNFLSSRNIHGSKFKLPFNLYIWATMNSADQGVMPLDSAFKRRWSFEYLPLNAKAKEVNDQMIFFQNKLFNWNGFRDVLNKRLIQLGVPEDKLIGPFFLNKKELRNTSSIKNKLLLYLRDDVVRHNPESLFKQKTFSEIVFAYDSNLEIFSNLNLKDEIGVDIPLQEEDQ
ncbi:MAG: AAA family ATPase [Bacteroidota bacterium]